MEGPGFPDHRHELEGDVTSARCSLSTRNHPSAPRPSFGGNFTACFHSPASREVRPPASLLHLASPPPRVGAGHSFSWGQGYNNNRTGRKITGGQGQVRVGVKKDAGACVGCIEHTPSRLICSGPQERGPPHLYSLVLSHQRWL